MSNDRDTKPSRKAAHNARIREKIRQAAAIEFRKSGYDGVGLNDLMAAADLTRGAFYAHFKSKEALFQAVLEEDFSLLQALRARVPGSPAVLWAGCETVFYDYLSGSQASDTWCDCTFATLASDVARRSPDVQRAFERTHRTALREMARGQTVQADDPRLISGLSLATGALTLAAASSHRTRRLLILDSARDALRDLWAPIRVSAGKGADKGHPDGD